MTRRVAVFALAALPLVLGACSPGRRSAEGRAAGHGIEADSGAAALPAASLFELAFPLTDADGRTRHIGDFRGAPFVASMVYTSCRSVCPRITADLKNLEKALPGRERAGTRFVLFSLDPARDTPEAMRAFVAEHALDPARWTLLAAGPDDMRTLAAVLGVRFRPDAGGEIAHSAIVLVVDSAGVVRHRQEGLSSDVAPLVAAVQAVQVPAPRRK